VSTRKVKAITEELCGHSFSASAISAINKSLDEALARFAARQLDEAYPYLILDARYEKIREQGVIRAQAVLIAIGINWEGYRQVLAVELASRESQSSWKDFLLRLKERGLAGVEFVVSDDHAGLKKAISEVLSEAVWQRCYVHFLRNALDYMPRKADDRRLRAHGTARKPERSQQLVCRLQGRPARIQPQQSQPALHEGSPGQRPRIGGRAPRGPGAAEEIENLLRFLRFLR
jgi:transposase-like protein